MNFLGNWFWRLLAGGSAPARRMRRKKTATDRVSQQTRREVDLRIASQIKQLDNFLPR